MKTNHHRLTRKQRIFKRLKIISAIIVLWILIHAFLYCMGIYHPEVKWESWIQRNYEDAIFVAPNDLVGKWGIGIPYYDAVYSGVNINMEGWKNSELILRSDKTFTFKPILYYTSFVYEGIAEEESTKILNDFKSNRNAVLRGKWSLDYHDRPEFHIYSIALCLHVENFDQSNDSDTIILGRITCNNKKDSLDRYRIIRTLSLDDYGNPRSFFYRRISLDP